MKVIDLLNKIANGEEVPKRINYGGMVNDYEYLLNNIKRFSLNDEVEIIEDTPKEDKKIDKLKYCMVDGYIVIGGTRDIDEQLRIICERINEIIDKVNGE